MGCKCSSLEFDFDWDRRLFYCLSECSLMPSRVDNAVATASCNPRSGYVKSLSRVPSISISDK
jgi:hypothetical protein